MGEKMVAGVPGYPAAGFLMALVLLSMLVADVLNSRVDAKRAAR